MQARAGIGRLVLADEVELAELPENQHGHRHARQHVHQHHLAPAEAEIQRKAADGDAAQQGASHQRRHRVADVATHAVDRHDQAISLGEALGQRVNAEYQQWGDLIKGLKLN